MPPPHSWRNFCPSRFRKYTRPSTTLKLLEGKETLILFNLLDETIFPLSSVMSKTSSKLPRTGSNPLKITLTLLEVVQPPPYSSVMSKTSSKLLKTSSNPLKTFKICSAASRPPLFSMRKPAIKYLTTFAFIFDPQPPFGKCPK